MTDAARIRRLEIAVALLGLTAAVSALIVMLDAIRFHAASFVRAVGTLHPGDIQLEGVAMLGMAAACVPAVVLALASAMRQFAGQRAFLRRLVPMGTVVVDGRQVVIVRVPEHAAFCAGLLRPRIFMSQRTRDSLSDEELRAVVAHEGHHADRRDPLRLLVGRALTSSLRVIPAVGALGRRQAVLAELAADAAAVRSLGDPAPLAGAMLLFDGDPGAVAPERVDHLLGEGVADGFPPVLLALAGLALGGVSAAALTLVLLPQHPELPVSSLLFCIATVAVIASPAWVVTRRLGRALKPSA